MIPLVTKPVEMPTLSIRGRHDRSMVQVRFLARWLCDFRQPLAQRGVPCGASPVRFFPRVSRRRSGGAPGKAARGGRSRFRCTWSKWRRGSRQHHSVSSTPSTTPTESLATVSALPWRRWGATCWWGRQGPTATAALRTCTTPRAICCTPSPATELLTAVSGLPWRWWGATCWWGRQGSTGLSLPTAPRTCTTLRAICCTPSSTPTMVISTFSAFPWRRWGVTCWWGRSEGATAAPLRTCTTLRASCCKPSPAPAVSSLPCRWWGATCWWGHQGSRTCTTPRAICCTPSPTPTELPTTVSALPRRRWGATCWWGQMGSTASAALRTCTTPRAICCTPLPTPTELPTTVSALPCRRWGTTWWWGQMGSTAPAARRTCTRASRTSGPATVPTTFGATRTTGPATPSLRPGMIWFSRAAPSRKPASMILGSLLIRSRLRTPIAFPGSP